jgi:hypothetical protein
MRRARAALMLLLLVTLSGCDLSWLKVKIPDFGSKKVQGIWVWRQVEGTTSWRHDTRLVFTGLRGSAGFEWLDYETVVGTLGQRGVVTASVQRTAGKTDEVTVSVGFLRLSAPGMFRVSTYNSSGESPLSSTSTYR